MNATAFGGKPREVVTPEKLLFDAAERLGRMREGRVALHVHLSRLLAQNRAESMVRIAFRMFESMVDVYRGQIFLLTNSDVVVICKDIRQADLDAIVYKLRALFAKDPLTYDVSPDGKDAFSTFYDLEVDYELFMAQCQYMVDEARSTIEKKRSQPQAEDLDARSLARVLEDLNEANISDLVRRQPCVKIIGGSRAEVAFQEFYVSIADLQRTLAPDVNLLANRWLFQHLSQVLDQRVLAALKSLKVRKAPVAFSLNLNMATAETPAFQEFASQLDGRARLLVELQLVDMIDNLEMFFRVRDQLRSQGIATVLDGVNAVTLGFVDAEAYDTDFVKVTWSPDMAHEVETASMVEALAPIGFDRVILSRCDTEQSIAWGLELGICHFQGRFIDSMIGAVTMAGCDASDPCSLADCIRRHGIISGKARNECGNLDMMDAFPPLQVGK